MRITLRPQLALCLHPQLQQEQEQEQEQLHFAVAVLQSRSVDMVLGGVAGAYFGARMSVN